MNVDIWQICVVFIAFLLYTSIFLTCGSIIYRIAFETNNLTTQFHSNRFTIGWCLTAIVFSLAQFLFLAIRLKGDISGLWDSDLIAIIWQSTNRNALLLRLIGLSALLITCFTKTPSIWLYLGGVFITLTSFATVGHTSENETYTAQIVLLIHVLGVAFWLGILFPLYRFTRTLIAPENTYDVATHFGNVATKIIPLLLIAGTWLAYTLIGSWENVFRTPYGQSLILKILFVIGLLILALNNKFRIVPKLKKEPTPSAAQLHNAVRLEIILFALIFAMCTVLTNIVSPPQ